jgi:hypothetical protein
MSALAHWQIPVQGRGPHGIEVHAELLAEAMAKLRAAGIRDEEITGPPVRLDDHRTPPRRVSLAEVLT